MSPPMKEGELATNRAGTAPSGTQAGDTYLITAARLGSPDAFYELLLEAHQGLTTEQSQAFNARLILLLANHIGSPPVLREALAAARDA